jgi:hypothetical protein
VDLSLLRCKFTLFTRYLDKKRNFINDINMAEFMFQSGVLISHLQYVVLYDQIQRFDQGQVSTIFKMVNVNCW